MALPSAKQGLVAVLLASPLGAGIATAVDIVRNIEPPESGPVLSELERLRFQNIDAQLRDLIATQTALQVEVALVRGDVDDLENDFREQRGR